MLHECFFGHHLILLRQLSKKKNRINPELYIALNHGSVYSKCPKLQAVRQNVSLLQNHSELKAEAVDYVTGLENEGSQELPLPIVALLVDSSPEADVLETLKASLLQVMPSPLLNVKIFRRIL